IIEDKSILGEIGEIRLSQLQEKAWSARKITLNKQELKKEKKRCILADMIYKCRSQGFNIETKRWDKIMEKKGGSITIEEILDERTYREQKENMRKWKVLYMEQLIKDNSLELLTWERINPGYGNKRKKPRWYSIMEENWNEIRKKITKKLNRKNQWKHIAMPKENKETQMKRVRWIAFGNREQVIIGRKKRKINEKKARILHYKEQGEHQELKECE